MTVDEIAAAVCGGDAGQLPPLWDSVERYVRLKADQAILVISPTCGVTAEDLYQTGYLALLRALKNYDPEKGAFLSWLGYALRTEFAIAAGYHTTRRDPLNDAKSLDAPLPGGDDTGEYTLLSTLPDSVDAYAEIDQAIYVEQLHRALDGVLDTLPAAQADTIRARYWEGMSYTAIGAAAGVSGHAIMQREKTGLQTIRRTSRRNQLSDFIDENTNFYRRVGVDRCRTEHTSSVEELVLWRDKLRRKWTNKS